jgi:outer membrane immunogenic protein
MKKLLIAGIATACFAAAPAAAQTPMWNWTGFYAGVTAGGVNLKIGNIIRSDGQVTGKMDSWNGIFGGTVGINWQNGSVVYGVEGDLSGSQVNAKVINHFPTCTGSGIGTCGVQETSLGTVRARAGYLVTPTTLVYATGGWAFGHLNSYLAIPGGVNANTGANKSGWTAGGGFEMMLAPNWAVKLEYLYVSLASAPGFSIPGTAWAPQGETKEQVIRVGLNRKFGN